MIILSCNNISLCFGEQKILSDVTLNIHDTDKIGIVGVNGAGKTTLLKVICGIIKPDSGDISLQKNCKIGYLSQDNDFDSSSSIWDELVMGFAEIIKMEKRINELHEKISIEKEQAKLSTLMKEYDSITDRFTRSGGYEYNSRIRGVLRGLGFDENQFDSKINTLSGGQRTRLSLAKLLLTEPDILLLDEPTNHLDLNALEWLEEFLKNYKKCVIVISHDRYFLDVVTNKIIELENCKHTVYSGNYSDYLIKKAEQIEIQQKHYELYQRETARMEGIIEQYKRWNRERSIIAAESRQKALDRMEKVDKPSDAPSKIQISFSSRISSAKDVVSAKGLSKSFDGKYLLKDINFKIKKGERVFLLGPNGCGKSTLLRMIVGKLENDTGTIELGYNVDVGYYDQHQEDIDKTNSIIDEVFNSTNELTQTQVRNALAAFLFKGEDVLKSISVLSGGERSRISLVKLMLSRTNFLILDEPTNHLDINSREILERALQNFDGTILAVSHDRYFIRKLATRIFEISNCSLKDFLYDYSTYLERKNAEIKNSLSTASQSKISASKLERLNAKEAESRQRKLEKQLIQTENEINTAEERLKEVEEEMQKEEIMSDHLLLAKLFEEQSNLKSKLGKLYELWQELEAEKEEF
ncbi:MAG: ABC-F family ATP-binding cassette domain-containing protein [Deltaproteobacteria bacterium]